MEVAPCQVDDVDAILRLYEHAVRLQRQKGAVPWPVFAREKIAAEVCRGMHWKIVVDGLPGCVWMITDSDPLIWQQRNADPAVYIHRIATNPAYQGRGFVVQIVAWAKAYAMAHGCRFLRMDTVGENAGLIRHYIRCGFTFLGLSKLADTAGLPAHYHDATVGLFEIDLQP